MEIRRNPVDSKGNKTTPIAWDMNCLEEVCGACSMVINGKTTSIMYSAYRSIRTTNSLKTDEDIPGCS